MNVLNNGLFSILTENGTKQNTLLLILMVFVSVCVSYILGSLSSAIIVSKAMYK